MDPTPVSLGAAIAAGYGVGLYENPVEAARRMVRVRKVYEPDPDRAALYDELYHGAYVHLYERLGDLMARISRLTTHVPQEEDKVGQVSW